MVANGEDQKILADRTMLDVHQKTDLSVLKQQSRLVGEM